MKFKYLSMFACAALIAGLTSCSDKNENEGQGPDVTAKETTMTISLQPLGVRPGTRATSEYPATKEECVIYNAKVYVFNSNKVLQQIVDLEVDHTQLGGHGTTTLATKEFRTDVGTKYFLAVANLNAGTLTNVPLGTSLDNLVQTIEGINQAKFTTMLDTGDATATDVTKIGNADPAITKKAGFLMTSAINLDQGTPLWYKAIDYMPSEIIPDPDKKGLNHVYIKIGRAMAKTSVRMLDSKKTVNHKKTGAKMGTVSDVQFVLTNNPTKMYYFPFFGTLQRFQTPEWTFCDGTTAPQNYWPALHDAALVSPTEAAKKFATQGGTYEGFEYKPTLSKESYTQNELLKSTFYAMENTNEHPTYGDATIAQVRVKFTPDASAMADAPLGSGASTYYRVWRQRDPVIGDGEWVALEGDGNEHKSFWSDKTKIYAKYESAAGVPGTDATMADAKLFIHEFTDGICFYMIPLRNTYLQDDPNQQKYNANIVYSVMRNHYYDINVTGITDSGYPGPGGKDPKDPDKPGPGDQTEPKDPLDPDNSPFITVEIEVKDWTWVKQGEEIGIRD